MLQSCSANANGAADSWATHNLDGFVLKLFHVSSDMLCHSSWPGGKFHNWWIFCFPTLSVSGWRSKATTTMYTPLWLVLLGPALSIDWLRGKKWEDLGVTCGSRPVAGGVWGGVVEPPFCDWLTMLSLPHISVLLDNQRMGTGWPPPSESWGRAWV